MNRRTFLPLIGAAASTRAFSAPSSRPPNIVTVLCDDLGYGDLHCFGHPSIQSPNLDRFAAQGTRFTDFYAAAPVCSPSRAGLLTGRTPDRCGIYDWIPPNNPMHLRRQEITWPALLRDHGYSTCLSGKWHLNGFFNSPQHPQPSDHGFQHWFATHNNAAPTHQNPNNFVRNGKPVGPLQGYSSTLIVDESIRWLDTLDSKSPFALHVCFHSPHEPIATAEEFTGRYPMADPRNRALYYGNVTQMDHEFGRLLAALQRRGDAENTLILFTSDNGPETLLRYPGSARSYGSANPLRSMKLSLYEGGYRVPGILHWPARLKPGRTDSIPSAPSTSSPPSATSPASPSPRAATSMVRPSSPGSRTNPFNAIAPSTGTTSTRSTRPAPPSATAIGKSSAALTAPPAAPAEASLPPTCLSSRTPLSSASNSTTSAPTPAKPATSPPPNPSASPPSAANSSPSTRKSAPKPPSGTEPCTSLAALSSKPPPSPPLYPRSPFLRLRPRSTGKPAGSGTPSAARFPPLLFYSAKPSPSPRSPLRAPAWVSGHSRYQLWVNGQFLQRGPAPSDPRYWDVDPIDLAPHLRPGLNVIAAIVCAFGAGDGTYVPPAPVGSGEGQGFLFQCDTLNLSTDATWKTHRPRCWRHGSYQRWFLRAFQEDFDARHYPENWAAPAFEDSAWKPAAVNTNPPGRPALKEVAREGWQPDWVLQPRTIPPIVESDAVPPRRHRHRLDRLARPPRRVLRVLPLRRFP